MSSVVLPRVTSDKSLFKVPKHAPGEAVAGALAHQLYFARADRLDAGDFAGDTTTQLFSAPANALIYDIIIDITEAFTAATTIAIGDGDDPDRFMDTTASAATAAGMKSMKTDLQPGSGGAHIYSAADTIDLTLSGATPTAGTIDVFLVYLLNADNLGLDHVVEG